MVQIFLFLWHLSPALKLQPVLLIVDPNSQPQLKNLSWKMEFDEIREKRRIRKWKEGFGEETETSRGGFLILGCRFPPWELRLRWSSEWWSVHLIRCQITQTLMRSDWIILPDIVADRAAKLFRRRIVVYVYELSFQTPEPTLNHYVVRPSGFAIHALPDSILTKEILVLTTRKLTPLIGIDYRRYSIPSDSLFYRVNKPELYRACQIVSTPWSFCWTSQW